MKSTDLRIRNHRIGIYPGTFDPVTYGHIDLIHRALGVFDEVIVGVAEDNTEKKPLFSLKERVGFLKRSVRNLSRVRVESFRGLVVSYAKKRHAQAIIRGIRMLSDFEYEFQMALTNRKLAPDMEAIFLMPHESYAYLSSRLIKEIASLKGEVKSFVPDFVASAIEKKCRRNQ